MFLSVFSILKLSLVLSMSPFRWPDTKVYILPSLSALDSSHTFSTFTNQKRIMLASCSFLFLLPKTVSGCVYGFLLASIEFQDGIYHVRLSSSQARSSKL
jgi:hypothetical protein